MNLCIIIQTGFVVSRESIQSTQLFIVNYSGYSIVGNIYDLPHVHIGR